MPNTATLLPDTLERIVGRTYGDVRRWRPIDPDDNRVAVIDDHAPPPLFPTVEEARR